MLTMTVQRLNRSGRLRFEKRQLREILNVFLIFLGALSAAMGLHGFLESSNFIDGGVTGISMLLAKQTGLPLSLFLPLVNAPFIILGFRQIGAAFAIRSMFAIALLSVILAVVEFKDVTSDRVLTAIFGGVFLGAGIGLAIRGNAVLDGTEIAALLISKRSHLFKVGDIILGINVAIFLVAMLVLGIEEALYSILTYVTAARTLDFLIYGLEQFTAITIVSERSASIRQRIMDELGRGVTIYKARGGKSGVDQEILYCVVTRLEIGKVKSIIREVDESAFVVTHALSDVQGGMVKRAGLH
ncbi:YitT family protein [Schlesneria paludicola]|uniref:YitT family protein n=1 Tax=Schlesneria paludicola TaxID=360056 RepID=UPI00029ACF29